MPIRFVDKYTEGFEVIIEAEDGHFLLGGRQVDGGPVFDTFFQALGYLKAAMESNLEADRRVRLGKVVEFRGMVSCPVLMSRGEGRRGLPT